MHIIVSAHVAKLSHFSSQPVESWHSIGLQTAYNPVPINPLGIVQTYPILKNNSN